MRNITTFEGLLAALKPYVVGWLGLWTPPMAHVYHGADQGISHNTASVLAFGAERYDPSDMHSTSTNNSRVTVALAGRYRLTASAEWASNSTGFRVLNLKLNGSTVIAAVTSPAVSGVATRQLVAIEYQLAAGDYIEVEVYQNSGASLNVAAQTYSPWLAVSWVGR